MKWLIRYYWNEMAQRSGAVAYREEYIGEYRNALVKAQNLVRNSQYKCFDIVQK